MIEPQCVFGVLAKYEQACELTDKKSLYRIIDKAIANPPLVLIVFSCLAVERGKEELVLDFSKTMFFNGGDKPLSRTSKRAIQLVAEIEAIGLATQVIPILVDTEPRRTWGWQTPQEELTLACQLMVEEAMESELLPPNWQPAIWSELESHHTGIVFEQLLELVRRGGKQQLLVAQQKKHLLGFSADYHFPMGVQEAAVRQVAAYAYEGIVLENVLPRAVLMQSEWPWREKDPLYQWFRLAEKKQSLPIIHPFPH